MRALYYILGGADGKQPIQTANVLEWARMFENHASRIVAQDVINGFMVSTVFLGLDHNWSGGTPVLFETMVLGPGSGESDSMQQRYSTWDEALAGHQEIARIVMGWNDEAGKLTTAAIRQALSH